MYTKEHLIHESVKVLKIVYYLVILLIVKILVELSFSLIIPQVTYTEKINYDKHGNPATKEETRTRTKPILSGLFFRE
jgi:hypothetical protein